MMDRLYANENRMDQQENVPPNNQNVPRNNRPDSSISPSMIPVKKRKYKSDEINQMHREAYNNMECSALYMQQRAQALGQGRNVSVLKFGPSSSTSSVPRSDSTGGHRTPSPDFAPSASHASSPLGAKQPPSNTTSPTPPPLLSRSAVQYHHQLSGSRARAPQEHNYAVSTTSSSTVTAPRSNPSSTSPARHQPQAAPTPPASDSGNSTLNDSINPLCLADWYKDLLKPEYAEKLRAEHDIITSRSKTQKEAFIAAKVAELPEGPDYFPNKSRLRKEYDNPEQAAERARNNQASRRSRFKKKRAQVVLNMQLEYDRNENTYLYAMQNWIEKVMFQLEASWLRQGATGVELVRLRRECGFPEDIQNMGWLEDAPH